MRRCFPAAAQPGTFRTGKWAGLPQSYDFILESAQKSSVFSRRVRKLWGFGGGQRSVSGRESGWILGDFSRGRWSISVIVSAFLLCFGGGRSAVDLCSRRVGRGATKKGASDSTRAVGCTEKGDHGAEIRRKLALSSSASGCHSPRGRRGRAVFVARPRPTAVGRRGSGVPW